MTRYSISNRTLLLCSSWERSGQDAYRISYLGHIEGEVETSPKIKWHPHDFKARSETNQDVTSHNVM